MRNKTTIRLFWLTLSIFVTSVSVSAATLRYTGVNLAGAEFGQTSLPGVYNTHYTYPTQAEVDYFRPTPTLELAPGTQFRFVAQAGYGVKYFATLITSPPSA